jgi:hypothetical protein
MMMSTEIKRSREQTKYWRFMYVHGSSIVWCRITYLLQLEFCVRWQLCSTFPWESVRDCECFSADFRSLAEALTCPRQRLLKGKMLGTNHLTTILKSLSSSNFEINPQLQLIQRKMRCATVFIQFSTTCMFVAVDGQRRTVTSLFV